MVKSPCFPQRCVGPWGHHQLGFGHIRRVQEFGEVNLGASSWGYQYLAGELGVARCSETPTSELYIIYHSIYIYNILYPGEDHTMYSKYIYICKYVCTHKPLEAWLYHVYIGVPTDRMARQTSGVLPGDTKVLWLLRIAELKKQGLVEAANHFMFLLR